MTEEQSRKFVPAVQNAAAILRLLAEGGRPLGATQIARAAGLNVSSAFNILRTLTHEGLLSFDPEAKTYRIGMGMMEFAAPLLGANPADLIRPMVEEIAREHAVMVGLWRITADERLVLIDRFAAPRIVQATLAAGARLPVFAGATGRCYAAAAGLDEAAARRGYDSVRWQRPRGFDAFWRDVEEARRTGTARDRGELFTGLEIVGAVARDAGGAPRLSLSSITIAGQHEEASLEAVATALAGAAARIERSVFGRRG